jgi:hypothetical protein
MMQSIDVGEVSTAAHTLDLFFKPTESDVLITAHGLVAHHV